MSQYSSWPTLMKALHFRPAFGREHVAVRAVGHVVAVLFEPVGERELERQELARAEGERVVDDAVVLRLAAVRPVEADVGPGPLRPLGMGVDRVVVGPAVVGLPGVVRALEQDVGRPVVADDEDDVALPVGLGGALGEGREPAQVDAAGPVGGNRQPGGRLPAALVQVFRAGLRDRLGLALERAERRHQAGASAAVIAHAKDLDLNRRGGSVETMMSIVSPALHALLRAIAFDPGGAEPVLVGADAGQLPVEGAGLAGSRRGSGSARPRPPTPGPPNRPGEEGAPRPVRLPSWRGTCGGWDRRKRDRSGRSSVDLRGVRASLPPSMATKSATLD